MRPPCAVASLPAQRAVFFATISGRCHERRLPEKPRGFEYKFFTQAIAIRVEVNKLMASSSVVPKAYRLLNAVPTVETARSIVYNVNRADCFYPNTSFNALERKRYLTLAIADCEQLMLDMQCLMDIGLPVNANRFEELAAMVEEEIRLLKGARKNVRVTGKKSAEERIAEAEAELERLRSL